ncbi:MAG: response regulator [Polyangiaceae bacterium]|jgi:CheY-like chemotaxis protein|nr:response regulator [Polyangiaceae bacterium]
MDWKLGGIDGIEASRRIRAHPQIRPTPFILMVTAYGREEVARKAAAVGIDAILAKPVGRSLLFDTILEVMGSRGVAFSPVEDQTNRPADRRDGAISKDEPLGAWQAIRGARVLLVEDHPINQHVAVDLLFGASLSIEIANNGKEALQVLEKHASAGVRVDLVLMDLLMPEMDGYEATRRIREDPRFRELPIVALTAHAMTGERDNCLNAGMNDYVSKPIEEERLMEALLRWIKPSRHREVPCHTERVKGRTSVLPAHLPGFDLSSAMARFHPSCPMWTRIVPIYSQSVFVPMSKRFASLTRVRMRRNT